MKGSFTVEASLVFPFCFLVIGVICFLGVFLYDQVVLKITGYESILQVMESENGSDEQFVEHLQRQAEEKAIKRVLAVSELQTKVKTSASKIIVSYQGRQTILNLPLDITIIYEKVFPELSLRLIRGRIGE